MRKVSYLPLWHLLLERGMTKSQMRPDRELKNVVELVKQRSNLPQF